MGLSVETIQAAFERDKNLAVNLCQRNDRLWRNAETRGALCDVSWAILDFNDSHMDSANTFNYLEDKRFLSGVVSFDSSGRHNLPEFNNAELDMEKLEPQTSKETLGVAACNGTHEAARYGKVSVPTTIVEKSAKRVHVQFFFAPAPTKAWDFAVMSWLRSLVQARWYRSRMTSIHFNPSTVDFGLPLQAR
jgi:hypothetical protein